MNYGNNPRAIMAEEIFRIARLKAAVRRLAFSLFDSSKTSPKHLFMIVERRSLIDAEALMICCMVSSMRCNPLWLLAAAADEHAAPGRQDEFAETIARH